MNLINSKTIHSSENIFWKELPQEWQVLTPKQVLVLTTPYARGGMEEETLLKMMSGCALTQDKFHILPFETSTRIALHALLHHFQPSQVILLGIEPGQLGISALLRFNEMNAFHDCIIIPSLSLPQLQQYPDAKKGLWLQALKPCFVP